MPYGLVLSLGLCSFFCGPEPRAARAESLEALQDTTSPPILTDTIKPKHMENIGKAYLTGQFDPAKDPRFSLIPAAQTPKPNIYLRTEALLAFQAMQAQAKKDGLKLMIISATRPFAMQKALWEPKIRGQKTVNKQFVNPQKPLQERAQQVLEYVAMPGTSRHHWGTDIDINSIDPAYFQTPKGQAEYAWLAENAPKFGFCQVYSVKGSQRPYGYEEEPWHWSYLPLAADFTRLYAELVNDQAIAQLPFEGASAAPELQILQRYVLGIDPNCQNSPNKDHETD